MPAALAPFRLERWFAEFEFLPGMRNLAASGPFPVTTRELLDLEGPETTARYLNLGLDYLENPGGEGVRQGVANLYANLTGEDVRMMSGASEALLLLIWATTEPGDNIIIEAPCYENVPGVAAALGIEVRRLPLRQADGWKPDPERLARLLDQKTRLVYLVHPHNPTGSALNKTELLSIAELTTRVGALLVQDEVFRLIALDGAPLPAVADLVDDALSIGDMTKPWGLGGLRVGWIASRRHDLLNRLSAARDYATMCSSAPGEFLAELALRHQAKVIAPRLATARANRERLAQAVADSQGALTWQRPEAGYTALVQFPASAPVTALCRRLAQEQRVLLLPGEVFGVDYEQYARFGFGCAESTFEAGLASFLDALPR